jgi:hypothetical protein
MATECILIIIIIIITAEGTDDEQQSRTRLLGAHEAWSELLDRHLQRCRFLLGLSFQF